MKENEPWILVEGAGDSGANGLYRRDPSAEPAPNPENLRGYGHSCHPFDYWVEAMYIPSGAVVWEIRSSTGTHYTTTFRYVDTEKLPPRDGWTAFGSEDNGPPPTLTIINPLQSVEKLYRAKRYCAEIKAGVHPSKRLRLLETVSEFIQSDAVDGVPVTNELKKNALLERIVALELAVWKAAALLEIPESCKGYHNIMDYMENGWKSNKQQTFRGEFVTTIMSCVMDYLERPQLEQPKLESDSEDDRPVSSTDSEEEEHYTYRLTG